MIRMRCKNIFLVPVLLLISFHGFAQEVPHPSRWENDMAAFDAMDEASPPPEGAIVLTGSSSIARWNDQAAEALAPLTVIPRGCGGSVMGDVLYHLDRVALRYKPRAILIYEGDNDTALDVSTDTILNQLRQIIDRVHEELPETRLYVLGVKPSILRWNIFERASVVNAGYRLIAENDSLVTYIDTVNPFLDANGMVMDDIFIQDNLHFNDMGNLIWGSVIRAALMPEEIRYEND